MTHEESEKGLVQGIAVMTAMWALTAVTIQHLWGWSGAVELAIMGAVLFGTVTVVLLRPLERMGVIHES